MGWRGSSNLSIVMLVSEAKGHFPRRLIISSCFDGVWLACNAGAHCALGKAYLKEDMLFFFLSVLVWFFPPHPLPGCFHSVWWVEISHVIVCINRFFLVAEWNSIVGLFYRLFIHSPDYRQLDCVQYRLPRFGCSDQFCACLCVDIGFALSCMNTSEYNCAIGHNSV